MENKLGLRKMGPINSEAEAEQFLDEVEHSVVFSDDGKGDVNERVKTALGNLAQTLRSKERTEGINFKLDKSVWLRLIANRVLPQDLRK